MRPKPSVFRKFDLTHPHWLLRILAQIEGEDDVELGQAFFP